MTFKFLQRPPFNASHEGRIIHVCKAGFTERRLVSIIADAGGEGPIHLTEDMTEAALADALETGFTLCTRDLGAITMAKFLERAGYLIELRGEPEKQK